MVEHSAVSKRPETVLELFGMLIPDDRTIPGCCESLSAKAGGPQIRFSPTGFIFFQPSSSTHSKKGKELLVFIIWEYLSLQDYIISDGETGNIL